MTKNTTTNPITNYSIPPHAIAFTISNMSTNNKLPIKPTNGDKKTMKCTQCNKQHAYMVNGELLCEEHAMKRAVSLIKQKGPAK